MAENTAPAPASTNTPTPAPDAAAPQTSGTNAPTNKPQPPKETPTVPFEPFEIQVNGKARRITTRDEAIRAIQLGYSATEKFDQAAGLSKKAQSIIDGAQKNPIGALVQAGLTKEQIRSAMEAWYSKEFIEPETLSKEELRARRAEERIAEYEAKEKEEREAKQRADDEQLTASERGKLQQALISAMEAHNLPKNKFTVSRMAFYIRQSINKGYEPPMELIVEKVRQERKDQVADMAQNATYEQLVEIFGEDTIKKIREYDLKQLRERRMGGQPQAQTETQTQAQREEKKTRPSDVNAYLKNLRFNK